MNWFKKHKIITVILVILVIAIAAGGASGSKSSNNTSSSGNKSSSKAVTAKVGEPANDGKFEFTVSNVKCGVSSVGSNQYLTKTAQGQYCLVTMTVKNIGDQSQSLLSSNQYLFNSAGQKYSADDSATLYNAPNGASWYNDINPGNSVSGAIVFDLPKDQTPTSAELHDSAFSNGVKVQL